MSSPLSFPSFGTEESQVSVEARRKEQGKDEVNMRQGDGVGRETAGREKGGEVKVGEEGRRREGIQRQGRRKGRGERSLNREREE